MVSAIKELVCTHLLFLEERLGIRIPFESPIVNHVVRYSARSRNIHHVPYLERDDCRVPLRLEDRAWWADSKLKSRGRRSSGGPRPMEVEEGKALRDSACDLESGELVELGSKSSSIGQEFGRLSFLLLRLRNQARVRR